MFHLMQCLQLLMKWPIPRATKSKSLNSDATTKPSAQGLASRSVGGTWGQQPSSDLALSSWIQVSCHHPPNIYPMEPQASLTLSKGPACPAALPTALRLLLQGSPLQPGCEDGWEVRAHAAPPPSPFWGPQSLSAIQHQTLSREVMDGCGQAQGRAKPPWEKVDN